MRLLPAAMLALVAAATSARAADLTWAELAPAFQPPAELRDDLGAFRSPLLFRDGTPVRTAADWPRRRAEIIADWHALMGPWPALLAHPRLEELSRETRENFTQLRIRLELAPGLTGEGYLLLPNGDSARKPAVVVPYYEPETSVGLGKNPLRDFALQLTRRGFVTLAIGSPGGDARQPALAGAQCQPLSFLAYIAANCWQALAARPEVDPARIGIVGHSYGGKWAMFASCLFEKFACAAWSDPGIVFDETRASVNYQEPWYLGLDPAVTRKPGLVSAASPRTGAYREMIAAGLDLHELHALIAPRPFLVSGGAEDTPRRWPALNHAIAVNRLLGFSERVGMTNRPDHTPTAESNAQIYAFFEHFLKKLP